MNELFYNLKCKMLCQYNHKRLPIWLSINELLFVVYTISHTQNLKLNIRLNHQRSD